MGGLGAERLMVSPEEAHDYDDMVPDMASLSYMFPDEGEAGKPNVTYACNAEDSLVDVSKKGNFTHKECYVCPPRHALPLLQGCKLYLVGSYGIPATSQCLKRVLFKDVQ
jgi:hypothetical protein